MPSAEQDLRILHDCLAGGPGARDAFARHFAPLVAGVVRDPDLRQEVFLALFLDDCRKLRQFDPARGSPAGWITLLARQTALKQRRKEGPAGIPLDAVPPPAVEGPEVEDLRRIRQALDELPPREALCLGLLVEQGLPPSDVAFALGVRRQAVYEIRDRALANLRRILGNPEI